MKGRAKKLPPKQPLQAFRQSSDLGTLTSFSTTARFEISFIAVGAADDWEAG